MGSKIVVSLVLIAMAVSQAGCDSSNAFSGNVPQDRIDLIKVKVERAIRVENPEFRDLKAEMGSESSVEVCGMVEQRQYGESIWRPFHAKLTVDDRMKLTTPTDTRPIEEAKQCFAEPDRPGCGYGDYDRLGWDLTLIECPQFQ